MYNLVNLCVLNILGKFGGKIHWLPIQQRVDFKLSVLMFNCLHNLAPSYLMNMCQPVTRKLHRRRLRSAVRGDLIVPPTRTVRYGPRSFAVVGPSTWNALPAPLRNDELSSVSFRELYTVSPKNCAFLFCFLLELRQISTNFNNIW